MKAFLTLMIALMPIAVQAQQQTAHVHNRTCFGGSCRVPSMPSVPQPIISQPRTDLGKLEALAEAIKDEQRYGTHVAYMSLSELQQIKLLLAMGATRDAARDAAVADVARSLPDPRTIDRAPPLPDPRTIERAPPLPDPRQVPPAQPLPNPQQVPNAPPLPGPTGIPPAGPLGISSVGHISWPQVSRTSLAKKGS